MKHQGYRLLCSSLGEDLAKKGPKTPKHIQTLLDLIDGIGTGNSLLFGVHLRSTPAWIDKASGYDVLEGGL